MNENVKSLGSHFIAEFYGCDPLVINNRDSVETIMNRAAEISGAGVIKSFFHRFSPQGISGIIVISESHFAIHTWPERGYAAVDLFSCGSFDHAAALRFIKSGFSSLQSHVSVIKRGAGGAPEYSDLKDEI